MQNTSARKLMRLVCALLLPRLAGLVGRERRRVRQRRTGPGRVARDLPRPGGLGVVRRLREVGDRLLRRANVGHRGVRRLQGFHTLGRRDLAFFPRLRQRIDARLGVRCVLLEDVANGQLTGVGGEFLFLRRHLLQHLAVDELRDREVGDLHRQPDHRDHVGDDQDDVLRHLRPRDRAHAAEE